MFEGKTKSLKIFKIYCKKEANFRAYIIEGPKFSLSSAFRVLPGACERAEGAQQHPKIPYKK